jgi:hypothetical protein
MTIIRSSRLHVCYSRLWCVVLGCWFSGVGCRAAGNESRKRDVARLAQHPSSWTHSLMPCTWPPTTSNQALHTIGCNNTHIVSRSWWWAENCPKHVEHTISTINHSVTSSWFFFSTHMQRCTDKHTSSWHVDSPTEIFVYSRTPLMRIGLAPKGKYGRELYQTNLPWKYSTVLLLLDLQIRRGRKV